MMKYKNKTKIKTEEFDFEEFDNIRSTSEFKRGDAFIRNNYDGGTDSVIRDCNRYVGETLNIQLEEDNRGIFRDLTIHNDNISELNIDSSMNIRNLKIKGENISRITFTGDALISYLELNTPLIEKINGLSIDDLYGFKVVELKLEIGYFDLNDLTKCYHIALNDDVSDVGITKRLKAKNHLIKTFNIPKFRHFDLDSRTFNSLILSNFLGLNGYIYKIFKVLSRGDFMFCYLGIIVILNSFFGINFENGPKIFTISMIALKAISMILESDLSEQLEDNSKIKIKK